jgi:hypothetical protein
MSSINDVAEYYTMYVGLPRLYRLCVGGREYELCCWSRVLVQITRL